MLYGVGDDPYFDEDRGVLRNLLDISDQKRLDKTEAAITSTEISALLVENQRDSEEFTWELLLQAHRQIFQDIYEWAGEVRTVEIVKNETRFAAPEHITTAGESIMSELEQENYLESLDLDQFVERLAHYYNDLNVLHPFREGNGRAIRTFLSMLGEAVGWFINWDNMVKNKT